MQDVVNSIHGDEFDWCPYAELYGDGYMVSNLSPGLLQALPDNKITLNTVRDLVGLEVTLSDMLQSYVAHEFGYQIKRIACQREVRISINDIGLVKQWLRETDNDIFIVHKQYAKHDEDSKLEEHSTLVPEKFVSLADFRNTAGGIGDYYVFSKDGDNYTLDKGIDCVVYMPGTAFNYEALAHIAKKVITVVEDETSTINN